MVLDGLPGIRSVKMILERDAFAVTYKPAKVSLQQIENRIRRLGYSPRRMGEPDRALKEEIPSLAQLPDPVATAVRRAVAASRLVFIDFYASWCGPCKVFEKEVLPAPEVIEALRGFELIKVDTDKFPDAAKHFQVVALPTLVVLDLKGNQRFRHLGPISIEALVKALNQAEESF